VLLQARLIFETLSAVLTNARESFLGPLANFCEGHRAGLVAIIHFSSKLLEFSLDRFCCTLLGENASNLVSIKIAFPIEFVPIIANQFHSTFLVLLPCVPITMVRVGKGLAADAAQDGDVVLCLLVVHQGVHAHECGLIFRAEIAGETFAMSVLDVLLQFRLGLATNIALLTLVGKASLKVDVLFRLACKFFAASFARHGDGLWASLIKVVCHCAGFL